MAMKIYKAGQGKYTRIYSGLGVGIVVTLGCLQLYKKLEAMDFGLWVETMIPVALFVVLGAFVFWLVNNPKVADFMIASEGEMKKVSWSSRKEITISTFIVIMVVIIMACLLGVTDFGFELIFRAMLN